MKPQLILSAIAACFAASAFAQLTWDRTTINFGTIKEADGKATRFFKYKNTGNYPVTITNVRTSCGCTTSDHKAKDVMPGDSALLPITYNPASRPGGFDKTVMVSTRDTTYKLNIYGNVIPSESTVAERYPEKLGNLRLSKKAFMAREIEFGQRRTARIYGYNMSADTLPIRFDNPPSTNFAVSVYPDTVMPGEVFVLSATFHADNKTDFGWQEYELPLIVGDTTYPISFTTTVIAGDDYKKSVDYGNAPHATIDTDRLYFDKPAKWQMARQSLTIKNDGKSTLEIIRAYSVDSAVSVSTKLPVKLKPAESATIDVNLVGKGQEVINSELIIFTNDPSNPNIKVRLVGEK